MKQKRILIVIYVAITIIMLNSIASTQMRRRPQRRAMRQVVSPVSSIGIRIGNDFKSEQLFLGGQFWTPVGIFWKFAPSFEYYFVDKEGNFNRWQFDGDFLFKPRPNAPFYLGGGVAVNYLIPQQGDHETHLGGNAIVGLDFSRLRLPSMSPYVQARWTFLEDENYFTFLGGFNFVLK